MKITEARHSRRSFVGLVLLVGRGLVGRRLLSRILSVFLVARGRWRSLTVLCKDRGRHQQHQKRCQAREIFSHLLLLPVGAPPGIISELEYAVGVPKARFGTVGINLYKTVTYGRPM